MWEQKFKDLRLEYENLLNQINKYEFEIWNLYYSGTLGSGNKINSIIVDQFITVPTEEMITYKCKDHCKISDFEALKEEYK